MNRNYRFVYVFMFLAFVYANWSTVPVQAGQPMSPLTTASYKIILVPTPEPPAQKPDPIANPTILKVPWKGHFCVANAYADITAPNGYPKAVNLVIGMKDIDGQVKFDHPATFSLREAAGCRRSVEIPNSGLNEIDIFACMVGDDQKPIICAWGKKESRYGERDVQWDVFSDGE